MIEIFTSNIQDQNQANEVLQHLRTNYPDLRINFDFGDWKSSAFSCHEKILRVEGPIINPNNIISTVEKCGFKCDVLPDKICK